MSNAPSWLGNFSKIQYLYNTYELAILVGRIVHNSARKYRDTYGTIMVNNCERAMYHGRVANSKNFRSTMDHDIFIAREYELEQMRAEIDNVATYAFIWFETIRQHDAVPEKEIEKIDKWENQIGDLTDDIILMIEGVLRSDRKLFYSE